MIDRIYRAYCYRRENGTRALFRAVISKIKNSGREIVIQPPTQITIPSGEGNATQIANHSKEISVAQITKTRFNALIPLRTFLINSTKIRRINIITDSISAGSLFGGVGTAMIFAAILANRLEGQLRVITRTERAIPENLHHLLALYDIELKTEVEFKFAAVYDPKCDLGIHDNDLFITTSWWTTAATLPSVPPKSIVYLLQEDERMFYPYGDDKYRCEEILKNKEISFIINTKLLFDHFLENSFSNIATNGSWFEPAFPTQVFYPRKNVDREKRRFFFYARPNNVRNLFYLGIEVIQRAITEDIFDLDEWDILFVGKDLPPIVFDCGYRPQLCENLSWAKYAELLGTIDLGLSLMCTPHPSYPPLDLAASCAVVVTNQFENKQDLSAYSRNLICVPLTRDALVEGLRVGVKAALDTSSRDLNFQKNGLLKDWNISFEDIISKFLPSP